MRDSLTVEIVRVRQENSEVTTLYFVRPFDFMAGQYITVFIEGSQVREGKAYSISSRPHEELMSITVKNVGGEFSSYLCVRAALAIHCTLAGHTAISIRKPSGRWLASQQAADSARFGVFWRMPSSRLFSI